MQLTTDKIRELLDYNEETGVFTWKASLEEHGQTR